MQSSEFLLAEDRAVRLCLGFGSTTAVLFTLTALLVPHSAGVAEFDEDVMASMSALRHPMLTTIAQIITDLGSYGPVAVASSLLAILVGWRARRLLEPVVLLAAVQVASSLEDLFKVAIARARPPLGGMLGAPVFDYSFPSGHTTSGTVLYVLAAMLLVHTETQNTRGRLLVAAGCALAGLIGLSRVYLGYHWLTDVVGSWVLAATVTSIAMAFITANQRPDWGTMSHDAVAPRDAFSRITSLVVGDDQPGPLVRR